MKPGSDQLEVPTTNCSSANYSLREGRTHHHAAPETRRLCQPGDLASATWERLRVPRRERGAHRGPGRPRADPLSPSRRPGRTSGSAPIRSATSRRPAWDARGESSTATTTPGATGATGRSSMRSGRLSRARSPSCESRWSGPAEAADLAREGARLRRQAARSRVLPDRVGGLRGEENETYGLVTMRKRHVTVNGNTLVFDYEAKGGKRRVQTSPRSKGLATGQGAVRAGGEGATSCSPTATASASRPISAADDQRVPQGLDGEDYAKDFRTWNATVLAAVAVADERERDKGTKRGRTNEATRSIRCRTT